MSNGISEWAKKPVSHGTLGNLIDPEHPMFNSFPTEFHTNWQWFTIIKSSRSLILNKTLSGYKPIIQVIDNLERNNKPGLIFEFVVGKGKLLICMSRLNDILEKPEAYQLFDSIIKYLQHVISLLNMLWIANCYMIYFNEKIERMKIPFTENVIKKKLLYYCRLFSPKGPKDFYGGSFREKLHCSPSTISGQVLGVG